MPKNRNGSSRTTGAAAGDLRWGDVKTRNRLCADMTESGVKAVMRALDMAAHADKMNFALQALLEMAKQNGGKPIPADQVLELCSDALAADGS